MIRDGRSNKVIFITHCLLNTNSLAKGPKTPSVYPAMINELIEMVKENEIGVIQLPCPEQIFFGFVRNSSNKFEMDKPEFRKHCKTIAKNISDLIEGYLKNNFIVLGFVGKRGSPSCGVKKIWTMRKNKLVEIEGQGIFIEELRKELERRNINIPFIDFEKDEIRDSVNDLKEMIKEE